MVTRKIIRDDLDQVIDENRLGIVKDKQEHMDLLIAKIDEELLELKETNYSDATEFADVIEVIVAIAKLNDIAEQTIDMERLHKECSNGIFDKGLVLNDI